MKEMWGTTLVAIVVLTSCAFAQSPVTLTIDTQHPGPEIPKDFVGVSFGPSALKPQTDGSHLFDSTNTQVLTIFRQLNIRYFRLGGTWVDTNTAGPNNTTYLPSRGDINAFFGFIKAAGVNDVIFSVRLENGDSLEDASTAKYIWDRYSRYLYAFAVGNEPNLYKGGDPEITDFSTYLEKWRRFAAAILDSVPEAKFGGPDNGTGGKSWASGFANDEDSSGTVKAILSHDYVGGSSKGMTAQQMVDAMLSTSWYNTKYLPYFDAVGTVALSDAFPYILTEANSFTGGNVPGGSNGFASALWVLDFMYWWASHGCSGVSVHTGLSNYNGIIHADAYGNWQVYPIAYGIKAFDVVGQGALDTITVSNPDSLNLSAFAVSDTGSLYVTIINKEHDTGGRNAEVTIVCPGLPNAGEVMDMTAPQSNPTATSGITLGGATINDNGSFHGKWSSLDSVENGRYVLKVPATSAAIVKIGGTNIQVLPPALLRKNGESGIPRRATFEWLPSSGAIEYNLQVASDRRFTDLVFDTLTASTTTQLSSPLDSIAEYYWRVSASSDVFKSNFSAIDSFTTGTGILPVKDSHLLPGRFALLQNYPNPFNPSTTVAYQLPTVSHVVLRVFDALGREVETLVDAKQAPGGYTVEFDGAHFSSGVYVIRLNAGSLMETQKIMLVK